MATVLLIHRDSKRVKISLSRSVDILGCSYLVEIFWGVAMLDGTLMPLFSTRERTLILQILIAMVAGWINRHQQHVIAYLQEQEENRILKAKVGSLQDTLSRTR